MKIKERIIVTKTDILKCFVILAIIITSTDMFNDWLFKKIFDD